MRNSSTDQIILDALTGQMKHLTSHEIYESVHQKLPAINPSTVYRALDRLVDAGKVSVSDMGLGADVYELTGDQHHHHLVCQKCGYISMIDDHEISAFFSSLEIRHHHKIITSHLILFGICEHCQGSLSDKQ